MQKIHRKKRKKHWKRIGIFFEITLKKPILEDDLLCIPEILRGAPELLLLFL